MNYTATSVLDFGQLADEKEEGFNRIKLSSPTQ